MSNQAFQSQGNTVALAPTSSQVGPTQVPGLGSSSYKIQNVGPNTAFFVASSGVFNNGVMQAPSVTVTIPVSGTPANGIPIQSGATQVITAPPNCWFSAICASTQSATLYITPGEGK